MTWHSIQWSCLLGWTLVLGLVLFASHVVSVALNLDPYLLAVVPSMIAALLIGVHIRAWWWVAGPLLVSAPILVIGILFLVLRATSSADQPGPMGPGGARMFGLSMGTVLTEAGVIVGILHAMPAIAGVWWGKRQEAADGRSAE